MSSFHMNEVVKLAFDAKSHSAHVSKGTKGVVVGFNHVGTGCIYQVRLSDGIVASFPERLLESAVQKVDEPAPEEEHLFIRKDRGTHFYGVLLCTTTNHMFVRKSEYGMEEVLLTKSEYKVFKEVK